MFGLAIQPEKEMVLIIAPKTERNDIMKAIIDKAGLNSMGKGICFTMPIDDIMGIALGINNPETNTAFDKPIEGDSKKKK